MLQGAGTKENILIEIFASRTNQQIKALSFVYLEGKEPQDVQQVSCCCGTELSVGLQSSCSVKPFKHQNCEFIWMFSSTETGKKLTYQLQKELGGDFGKALLLLAEVRQQLLPQINE